MARGVAARLPEPVAVVSSTLTVEQVAPLTGRARIGLIQRNPCWAACARVRRRTLIVTRPFCQSATASGPTAASTLTGDRVHFLGQHPPPRLGAAIRRANTTRCPRREVVVRTIRAVVHRVTVHRRAWTVRHHSTRPLIPRPSAVPWKPFWSAMRSRHHPYARLPIAWDRPTQTCRHYFPELSWPSPRVTPATGRRRVSARERGCATRSVRAAVTLSE